jgi:hypothetical protein
MIGANTNETRSRIIKMLEKFSRMHNLFLTLAELIMTIGSNNIRHREMKLSIIGNVIKELTFSFPANKV